MLHVSSTCTKKISRVEHNACLPDTLLPVDDDDRYLILAPGDDDA